MRIARLAAAMTAIVAASVALTNSASAHVTIPDPGEQGGFSIVTFSVPNERDDSSTVTIEVQLPQDQPLAFVSVQPKPGWTVETTTRTLDEPVSGEGEDITEVVDTVTWSGGEIGPGEFDTFSLSVGPLPDDVDELAFPTIQTYDDGEEVAWIEDTPAGGEEPEHPTPVLALVASDGDHHGGGESTETTVAVDDEEAAADTDADDSEDDGSDGLAVAALVLGVIGVLLGGAALLSTRRRPAP